MTNEPDSQESDGQLLNRFLAQRDESAFAELVERHAGMVYGVCRRMLSQTSDAEDAMQAVFVMLAQKAGSLAGRSTLAGWLHQAAINVAMHARRARTAREKHNLEAMRMKHRSNSSDAIEGFAELKPFLDGELHSMPEKYRLTVIMHYFEGYSYEEAAALLGISVKSFSVRLSRARQRLRRRLTERAAARPSGGREQSPWPHCLSESGLAISPMLLSSSIKAALSSVTATGGAALSTKIAALSQGGLRSFHMAKIKFAAAIAIPLATAFAGFVTYQAMAETSPPALLADATPAPAAAASAPATLPSIDAVASLTRVQSAALAKKLDVSYRRAFLVDVLSDLKRRSGLRVAYPSSILRCFTVSFDLKGATVREILDRLATEAKLQIQYADDVAAIWKPADDQLIKNLGEQLANADRWQRLSAIWQLAMLGDRRCSLLLAKVTADQDRGVSLWAQRALSRHQLMLQFMDPQERQRLAGQLTDKVKDLAREPYRGATGFLEREMNFLPLTLLAATHEPDAQKLLLELAQNPSENETTQGTAIGVLTATGSPESVNELLRIYRDNLDAVNTEKIRQFKANPNLPFQRTTKDIIYRQMAYEEAFNAIAASEVPEAISWAMAELKSPMEILAVISAQESHDDGIGVFISEETAQAARVLIKQEIQQPPPPSAGPVAAGTTISDAANAAANRRGTITNALSLLAGLHDRESVDLMDRVLKSKPILSAVNSRDDSYIDPTDPKILADLLEQLKVSADNPAVRDLVIRSLGHSHLPAAADALIAFLADKNPDVRVLAAQALARTGDDRAAGAIANTLKTPNSTLPWPDYETADQQAIAAHGSGWQRPNPRKLMSMALASVREPRALTLLLAIAADASLEADARQAAQAALPDAVITADDAQTLLAALIKMSVDDQRNVLKITAGMDSRRPLEDSLFWANPKTAELIGGCAGGDGLNSLLVRLLGLATPAGEKALDDLSKAKDDSLAKAAAHQLRKYGDPTLDR